MQQLSERRQNSWYKMYCFWKIYEFVAFGRCPFVNFSFQQQINDIPQNETYTQKQFWQKDPIHTTPYIVKDNIYNREIFSKVVHFWWQSILRWILENKRQDIFVCSVIGENVCRMPNQVQLTASSHGLPGNRERNTMTYIVIDSIKDITEKYFLYIIISGHCKSTKAFVEIKIFNGQ